MSNNIKAVLRVRPCFDATMDYENFQPNELSESGVRVEVPNGVDFGRVSKQLKPHYEYEFSSLFWKNSKQNQIFDQVAVPLINHALEGCNATLFAYGQTGSGKTYTLSGGESWEERGIIPRTIAFIFQQVKQSDAFTYDVRVSYIEIYQERAYDLLSTDTESRERSLDKLARVQMYETNEGEIVMMHDDVSHQTVLRRCEDNEQALSLLFLGETNRAIAATASNDVSSRSHCIFSIHLEGRNVQTGQLKRSKIHLVDLAGSERMDKVGDNATRVQEARYINESLFHLHNVIKALRDKASFIPYRSSAMTMFLKDSLGGNCYTTMIATVSSKTDQMLETLRTLKFASEVMSIKNNARVNMSLDPQVLIAQLRAEIVRLKHELAVARGEEDEVDIGPEETQRLIDMIKTFMHGKEPMPAMSQSRAAFCFDWIRSMGYTGVPSESKGVSGDGAPSSPRQLVMSDAQTKKAMNKLARKLQRREVEIGVLVNMLNQRKNRAIAWTQTNLATGSESQAIETPPVNKKDAFKDFLQNHPKFRGIEANNETMKKKIMTAKALAEDAHALKAKITQAKADLKQKTEGEDADDQEESIAELSSQIAQDTERYMKMCSEMKTLKTDVETLKAMIDQGTKQVKKDFADFWMGQQRVTPTESAPPAKEERSPSALSEHGPSRPSSGLAMKTTGDPQADEKIRKFAEQREQFRNKLDELRRSQHPGE